MTESPSLTLIEGWARQAGRILKTGAGKKFAVRHKSEIDLVTEMDHRSEEYLLGEVRRHFPDTSIVSEEAGELAGSNPHSWHIDPLDGTVNYAHGIPIYCVSIAYAEDGQVKLGVVYDPSQDELFSAERGNGAWLNGKPIHCSQAASLDRSLLVTGYPYDIRRRPDNNLAETMKLSLISQGVRRLGSAALDLCYVAAGRFDGYWEPRLHTYDFAAGWLIAAEAGARITRMNGDPDLFTPPYSLVAAPPGVHGELMEALKNV